MKRKKKLHKPLSLVILLISCLLSVYILLDKNIISADNKAIYERNDTESVISNGLGSNPDSTTPSLEGTTYVDAQGNTVIKNTDDILVLVNKTRNLPSDYKPDDLVIPNIKFSFEENLEKKYMRKDAAIALQNLFDAAKQNNISLFGVSGYRSYQRQELIFEAKANKYGRDIANKTSALPGQSEHQTGLAMDISCSSVNYLLTEQFGQTPEGKWLKDNAYKFGFIIRYPKDKTDITGYNYEPWHVRYVGKNAAKVINENNITLEEYFR